MIKDSEQTKKNVNLERIKSRNIWLESVKYQKALDSSRRKSTGFDRKECVSSNLVGIGGIREQADNHRSQVWPKMLKDFEGINKLPWKFHKSWRRLRRISSSKITNFSNDQLDRYLLP